VCLSAAPCPHYCTDPDVTWGSASECLLVVHCWVGLQSEHRLRCYGNITRTRKRQPVHACTCSMPSHSIVFTRTTLASAVFTVVVCLSVRSSVTSRCSTETAKRRITHTAPYDSPWTLVFCCRKSRQNSNGVTHSGCAKCGRGMLIAGAVAEIWRLSTRSVVNLARSQVYHTERPPCLFAARSP